MILICLKLQAFVEWISTIIWKVSVVQFLFGLAFAPLFGACILDTQPFLGVSAFFLLLLRIIIVVVCSTLL
jgi:hypothetical protein